MMKKIYFILLCVVMTLAMAGTSNKVFLADERVEFWVAVSAVILSVIAAAQDKDLWRGIFYAAGLILTVSTMGLWSILIFLLGSGIILYITNFYPEVKKMITDFWELEDDTED
ncbi:MAG: hypothetical protein IJS88_04180 [Alphaproteobacteria bacterium]|nr:hypothetical protein [Alphaproteobacteria bacterium]